MKQIRNGVFETNSSSSHSISIKKSGRYYTTEEICDSIFIYKGEIHFDSYELEFGRSPFEPLITFYDKLRFAIASLGDEKKYREEIEAIMYDVIPNLKSIKYPMELNWKTDKLEICYGYIDHQSSGLLSCFLNKNNISLREFLLNNKYIVFIDGDEYCIKETLFKSGLLHEEDFEKV